jgi:hypothetical protein
MVAARAKASVGRYRQTDSLRVQPTYLSSTMLLFLVVHQGSWLFAISLRRAPALINLTRCCTVALSRIA